MFKREVKTVTKEFVQKLEENGLIYLIDLSPRMQHSTGNFYNLYFLKVWKLPKTQMDILNDSDQCAYWR